MQRLDRYVTSYLVSSYGVCLLFFVGMFVLIDVFQKSDDIFENAAQLAEMGYSVGRLALEYYALMVPFIFLMVSPFVTVMAAIFAITRLRRNNELVPMIVGGRSVFRILRPMFVFAFALFGFMAMVQQYVAPHLSSSRERIKNLLFDADERLEISGLFPDTETRFVMVRDYDVNTRTIKFVDVSVLDKEEPPLQVENVRWDEARRKWLYEAGANGSAEVRELDVALTPDVIESLDKGPYDLSYSQAENLHQRTGKSKWKVLLHYHITFPLSNLLLLMLGLPFVLRHEKRGLLLGMVISILICASYFAFDGVMRSLGEKDVLHPVLAAWFGIIFFGSLGVVLIDGIKT